MATESLAVKRARNRRQIRRRQAIAAGVWKSPFVDAAPICEHITHLRAQGVTLKRITELSGLPRGTVYHLVYSVDGYLPQRVRRETAEAILAVRPRWDGIADNSFVPAVGTVRRLQALVAVGWPARTLAARLGLYDTYMNVLLRGEKTRVLARFARTVTALYDALWNVDPIHGGVLPAAKSRAQSRARGHQWSLPAAWDDELIDDPNAGPDYGEKVPAYVAHVENLRELERQGYTREQIADRLGVTRDTLQRAIAFYRERFGSAA